MFSASNYCGDYGNWGGLVQLIRSRQTGAVEPHVYEHWAPTLDQIEAEQTMFKGVQDRWQRTLLRATSSRVSREEAAKAELLKGLAERIVEHKDQLQWYFERLDSQATGLVSEAEWRDAMDAVPGG